MLKDYNNFTSKTNCNNTNVEFNSILMNKNPVISSVKHHLMDRSLSNINNLIVYEQISNTFSVLNNNK